MTTRLLNNRYQILKTLGRGGFGETFLATDTHMPSARQCVIKQLKPVLEEPQIPEWLKERFQREAIILEELGEHNPQIPRLYAYFTEQGNFYLVQEWVEGLTLTQKHEQIGNFSSDTVQTLLIELLPVLDYIHQRRIIHRDIKPDNIILRAKDGKPILIDFGIIKEAIGTIVNSDGKSAYSIALGTPGYMASEQAAGRPVYSSDLYSLGLTAIFLLTGKTPQYLKTDSYSGEIQWRNEAPQVSLHLAEVLDRCIRFHPRDRFGTAKDMLKALVSRIPAPTPPTLVVASPPDPPPRQRRFPITPPAMIEEEKEEGDNKNAANPFVTWFLLPLTFLVIIVGGLTAGFLIATHKRKPPLPSPTPLETIEPTPRQPESFSTPTPLPTRTPLPTPPPQATPLPEISPSPEVSPSAEVSPSPEIIPSPEITPSDAISPSPLFPVSPSPAVSASPSPEVTPVPTPIPSRSENPTPAISPPAPPAPEKPVNEPK